MKKFLAILAKYAVQYAPSIIEAIMKAKAEKAAQTPPPSPPSPPGDIEK
jgi:hypothetical protein